MSLIIYRKEDSMKHCCVFITMVLSVLLLLNSSAEAQQATATGMFGNDSVAMMVRFNQERAMMLNNKGLVQYSKGEYLNAVKSFTDALTLSGDMPEVLYNRGVASLKVQNELEALIDFGEAIQLDPRPSFLYSRGILLLQRGDTVAALSDLEKASLRDTANASLLMILGQLYIHTSDYSRGTDFFQQVLTVNPSETEAFNGLAMAMLASGDTSGAILQLAQSLEVNPEQRDIFRMMGDLRFRQRNYEGAMKIFRSLVLLDPADVVSLNALAVICLRKDDPDSALIWCEKALKADQKYAPAWNTHGIISFHQDDFVRAEADCTMAISLMPGFGEAFYNRGLSREHLRDELGACEDYRVAAAAGIAAAAMIHREICQ
jgi:Flp pilus assembly protein TadD